MLFDFWLFYWNSFIRFKFEFEFIQSRLMSGDQQQVGDVEFSSIEEIFIDNLIYMYYYLSK